MVKLPFIRKRSTTPEPLPLPTPADGSPTVLLVEDERVLRKLFADALRRDGYSVLEAAHGAHALVVAEQAEHIDLVVTDVRMPEMDGLQLGMKLRESNPGLPILYLSGYPLDPSDLGPNTDVLQKPFPWQALHDKTVQAVGLPVPHVA